MLKLFALIALGVQALDKCSDHGSIGEPVKASEPVQGDKFCENFCAKYEGDIFRGICGIQNEKTACYRVVALNGDDQAKPKFCNPVECAECLEYINKGGFCSCGFDCYDNQQEAPLTGIKKRLTCSKFHAG